MCWFLKFIVMFLEFVVMFLDFYCCFGSVTSPTVSDARDKKKVVCCSEHDLLLIYRIRIEKIKCCGTDGINGIIQHVRMALEFFVIF
jgi:hypothetical protein